MQTVDFSETIAASSIAPVPVHCFSITFISRVLVVVQCGGPKKSPRTSI